MYLRISPELLEPCESFPTWTFSCQKASKSVSIIFFFFFTKYFHSHLGTAPHNQSRCACLAMGINSTIRLIILLHPHVSDSIRGYLLKPEWVGRGGCSLGCNYDETEDSTLANREGHMSGMVKR